MKTRKETSVVQTLKRLIRGQRSVTISTRGGFEFEGYVQAVNSSVVVLRDESKPKTMIVVVDSINAVSHL